MRLPACYMLHLIRILISARRRLHGLVKLPRRSSQHAWTTVHLQLLGQISRPPSQLSIVRRRQPGQLIFPRQLPRTTLIATARLMSTGLMARIVMSHPRRQQPGPSMLAALLASTNRPQSVGAMTFHRLLRLCGQVMSHLREPLLGSLSQASVVRARACFLCICTIIAAFA